MLGLGIYLQGDFAIPGGVIREIFIDVTFHNKAHTQVFHLCLAVKTYKWFNIYFSDIFIFNIANKNK
jgi:hypothetical protein